MRVRVCVRGRERERSLGRRLLLYLLFPHLSTTEDFCRSSLCLKLFSLSPAPNSGRISTVLPPGPPSTGDALLWGWKRTFPNSTDFPAAFHSPPYFASTISLFESSPFFLFTFLVSCLLGRGRCSATARMLTLGPARGQRHRPVRDESVDGFQPRG